MLMLCWNYAHDVRMGDDGTSSPSPRQTRRVALLGIAQRSIRVKFSQKVRKSKQDKPLPDGIKTIGDWIQVKRIEKNLTPCHVAAKMGIASSLVCSWENSSKRPDSQQLKVLSSVLGFDAKDFESHSSNQ